MSVAYAYFKYIIDRENNKSLVYYFPGKTDVRLILDQTPAHWDEMATSEAKDSDIRHEVIIEANEEKPEAQSGNADEQEKCAKCNQCLTVLFITLGVLGVIAALALIILAILTSIATKAYNADQSSRTVAMVLLAVSAAVTICVIIYGEVAVFKKQSRSIHAAAVVILLLAIVQAMIAGISLNVEPADEAKLLKSLTESFKLAREDNTRHLRMWSMTQADLNCCGVYGPEDYRSSKLPYYFPPNVPISCCPTYDSSRSDLVQERDRELCKVKKTYYTAGCEDLVLTVFKETSAVVFTVSVILIVVEVLLMIIGGVLCRRDKKEKDTSSK